MTPTTVPELNTVLLLALMPAVLGLVNFFKSLGLEGKALTVVSMVIGILAAVAAMLLPPGIFSVAYNGLILGLAACGLYDLAMMVSPWKNMKGITNATVDVTKDKAAG